MVVRRGTADTGLGVSFIISTVIHLAVFLLVMWWGAFSPGNMKLQETYYVDIVNLPVAAPQAGSPQEPGQDSGASPPESKTSSTPMTLPAPPKGASAKAADKTVKNAARDDADESSFAERMARLEGKSEASRQAAALERLRSKVKTAGSGRSGMPAGSCTEAGSDYTAYIQSRLKDAFRETISSTISKEAAVVIRIVIGTDGRISRQKMERSSGERALELAAIRAIDMAADKFKPPPGNKVFEGVFVFKRDSISNTRP